MPQCKSCKEDKPTESFALSNKKADGSYGRRSLCKTCYSRSRPKLDKEGRRQSYLRNTETFKNNARKWAANHPERVAKIKNKWKLAHPEQYKRLQQESEKRRLKNNLSFKLGKYLRNRLNAALQGRSKAGSAVADLGCSLDELKVYLEQQFHKHPVTGAMMTWNNYTYRGWHVDHIMPLCKFDLTDRKQLLRACHFSNLRPLWMLDNLRKSGK